MLENSPFDGRDPDTLISYSKALGMLPDGGGSLWKTLAKRKDGKKFKTELGKLHSKLSAWEGDLRIWTITAPQAEVIFVSTSNGVAASIRSRDSRACLSFLQASIN